jgi:hypothetical protein
LSTGILNPVYKNIQNADTTLVSQKDEEKERAV